VSWEDDLTCRRSGHRADVHGVDVGCLAHNPEDCSCPLTNERIYDRAVQRMTAGLEP
jgi:hypothetical protein